MTVGILQLGLATTNAFDKAKARGCPSIRSWKLIATEGYTPMANFLSGTALVSSLVWNLGRDLGVIAHFFVLALLLRRRPCRASPGSEIADSSGLATPGSRLLCIRRFENTTWSID